MAYVEIIYDDTNSNLISFNWILSDWMGSNEIKWDWMILNHIREDQKISK